MDDPCKQEEAYGAAVAAWTRRKKWVPPDFADSIPFGINEAKAGNKRTALECQKEVLFQLHGGILDIMEEHTRTTWHVACNTSKEPIIDFFRGVAWYIGLEAAVFAM